MNEQKAIEFVEADAFELMRQYADAERRYETIVLDPPAFAKSKKSAEDALRGYKELNLRALKMVRNGGVLVTCSCSFHVERAGFSGHAVQRRTGCPPQSAHRLKNECSRWIIRCCSMCRRRTI